MVAVGKLRSSLVWRINTHMRCVERKQAACKHLQAACFDGFRLIGLIAPKSLHRVGRVRSSTSWQSHTRARRP